MLLLSGSPCSTLAPSPARRPADTSAICGSPCVAFVRPLCSERAQPQLATRSIQPVHGPSADTWRRERALGGESATGEGVTADPVVGDDTRIDGGRDGTDMHWVMTPHDRTRRPAQQPPGPQAASLTRPGVVWHTSGWCSRVARHWVDANYQAARGLNHLWPLLFSSSPPAKARLTH